MKKQLRKSIQGNAFSWEGQRSSNIVLSSSRLLTHALVKVIENRGGRVVIGKANGFLFETITTHTEKDQHHQTSPIRATKLLVDGQDPIDADIFILAMGPWTCKQKSFLVILYRTYL